MLTVVCPNLFLCAVQVQSISSLLRRFSNSWRCLQLNSMAWRYPKLVVTCKISSIAKISFTCVIVTMHPKTHPKTQRLTQSAARNAAEGEHPPGKNKERHTPETEQPEARAPNTEQSSENTQIEYVPSVYYRTPVR